MTKNPDYEKFDAAMSTILKADPKAVKAAMEQDKKDRAEQRKTTKTIQGQPNKQGGAQ